MPIEGDLDADHFVVLVGYDDASNRFTFRNSWGKDWGDEGNGTLPYAYVDSFMQEAWISLARGPQRGTGPMSRLVERSWCTPSDLPCLLYGFELWNGIANRPLAWAFAVGRDGHFEVEELFVMPDQRRRGYGGKLLGLAEAKARELTLPLRIWIPHGDLDSPVAIDQFAKKYGRCVIDAPFGWAAGELTAGAAAAPNSHAPRRPPGLMHRGRWGLSMPKWL